MTRRAIRSVSASRQPGITSSAVAMLLIAGSAVSATAETALPAAIAAPGETPVLSVHAEGEQLYECKAGADGKLAWSFREPIAALIADGKTIGRHYAGPTWEDTDGSMITGKVSGTAPGAAANDIAWLKLDVVAHHGDGVLSGVTTVQRINTVGGKLDGACDKPNGIRAVPYSAEYVFLHKG